MRLIGRFLLTVALISVAIWLTERGTNGGASMQQRNLRDRISLQNTAVDEQRYPEHEIYTQQRHLSGGAGTNDAAVDDHAAGGHPSLFEALSAIHVKIGTYSVLIIIGFIIILKQMIEGLYTFTHETPFHGMVKMIEEELMIVGTSSFIFKVVINTTTFGENVWAYPLEFGEVLVPLIAFSYCGIGVLLIMISLKQCYTWSRAHNLKGMEILDEYFEASKTWIFKLSWKPLNKSIEQMEFRILHNLFCKTFNIQKGAFAFDEYVAKVFQRSVLELIEIRLIDWFYVSVLLLLNLARVELNLHLRKCHKMDEECDQKRTVLLFTLVGSIIFFMTFLLLIASRRLELAIIRKSGPKSYHEYAQYIKEEDEKTIVTEQRMDLDQLKVAAAKVKEKENKAEVHSGTHGRGTIAVLAHGVSMRFNLASGSKKVEPMSQSRKIVVSPAPAGGSDTNKVTPFDDSAGSQSFSEAAAAGISNNPNFPNNQAQSQQPETSNLQRANVEAFAGVLTNPPTASDAKSDHSSSLSSEDLDDFGDNEGIGELVPVVARNDYTNPMKPAGKSSATRPVEETPSSKSPRLTRVGSMPELTFGEHSKETMDVFWFGRPELHFESVQILFMIISFYAALWLTVMASSANSGAWKFLSIAPAILICCFFFYIVKTAALLKAIYVVDTDAMLEVIEETEAAKQLSDELRERVLQRLEATSDEPLAEIERLYNEIDVNGNDSLSRREFGQFMELMGISFSVKKWEKIFKEVDRNYDNEISLNEFLLFLYPDHDVALSMENKRLKAISQRVMDRANNLLSHLTPLTDIVGVTPARRSSVGNIALQQRRASIPKIHPPMSRNSSTNSQSGLHGGGATAGGGGLSRQSSTQSP